MLSEEAGIARFMSGYSANTLVYDMREGPEALAKSAGEIDRTKTGKQTLFVYNDSALPLAQGPYARLAAINTLLEKHIPREVRRESDALRNFVENLRIAAAAAKSILESA